MPIPSYHEMLPAPSPFGSLPTSLEVPKDSAPAQAADIRRVASAVLGVGEYLDTRLTTAESDKITGNGAPPSGGYTPTTRAIEIKGTGLKMSSTLITGRVVRGVSHAVPAADQTIGPADGNYHILATPGATTWTIDLDVVGCVAGEFMRFALLAPNAAGGYIFRNSDTLNEVCGISGTHADITGTIPSFVEVEFDGAAWIWSNGCIGSVVLP